MGGTSRTPGFTCSSFVFSLVYFLLHCASTVFSILILVLHLCYRPQNISCGTYDAVFLNQILTCIWVSVCYRVSVFSPLGELRNTCVYIFGSNNKSTKFT